ncbi:tetratricopeptide repeat protein [Mucilaginibacter hurinus]|uniref:Tetratricopeptide repeat protein n=1 Tax=Mucilaginibacter hurinus TaxID=2201324 RepID=A0A367GLF1_9SPHI|nr:tetratricopeptide repeat protein [Mucilaginibacter hurinus]RCH54289.1 tetratricopeptide repeat protein [Mucilaginibacter hurinus]
MFTNQARIMVSAAFLLLAAFFVYKQTFELVAVCLLLIGLLIWGYFKEGTIILAAKHFHQKEYDKAENLLLQIKNPGYLGKKRRGFYEFIMGGINLQKRDYEAAEKHFEIAAQYPLRSVNDHVAALVHVATISFRNGNIDKAKAYLELAETKKDGITAKMKDVLNTLRQELKKK